jgi:DNA modification methylase
MRTEVIGDATLMLGDCLEILPTLGRVDAVVTDPPYLIDAPSGALIKKMERAYLNEIYESGLDKGADVADLFIAPHVVSFCNKKQLAQYIAEAEARCYVWTLLTWNKTNPTPFAKNNYLPDTEYIFHMWKGGGGVKGDYHSKRRWFLSDVEKNDFGHPTVKPLHIVETLVRNASAPDETILDPFMGSGTTGVATLQLGRKFIGIEIDKSYFSIACRRIEEAWKQPRLFEEPKRKPKPAPNFFDGAAQ